MELGWKMGGRWVALHSPTRLKGPAYKQNTLLLAYVENGGVVDHVPTDYPASLAVPRSTAIPFPENPWRGERDRSGATGFSTRERVCGRGSEWSRSLSQDQATAAAQLPVRPLEAKSAVDASSGYAVNNCLGSPTSPRRPCPIMTSTPWVGDILHGKQANDKSLLV